MAPITRRARKALEISAKQSDIITTIPNIIKEKILTSLPTNEAIRTSILSKQWRNTWTTVPKLHLSAGQFEGYESEQFERSVDSILYKHNGQLDEFKLNTREICSGRALDRYILKLTEKGVKDVTFSLMEDELPTAFFSCNTLRKVNLRWCSLKLPLGFEGLKDLIYLELKGVCISKEDFEKLVSSSPKLERFSLSKLDSATDLKIQGPNLKELNIKTAFLSLEIYAPKLVSSTLEFKDRSMLNNINKNPNRHNNFIGSLGSMPEIENMSLQNNFLTYLSHAYPLKRSDFTFPKLKYLYLQLNFDDDHIAAIVLSLLEKSPNLETLDIWMYLSRDYFRRPIINYWSSLDLNNYVFENLKHVSISKFEYDVMEITLSFIEMILWCSPNLEKLELLECMSADYEKNDAEWYLSELNELRETSYAEVSLHVEGEHTTY